MPYTPIRRDFVFDMKCHACPQPLRSNTAFILRDDEGLEHPFGRTCARKQLGEDGPRLLRQVRSCEGSDHHPLKCSEPDRRSLGRG